MIETYISGILRHRWNDTTRTYTEWNAQGVQVTSRAYDTEENARADSEALVGTYASNRATIETQATTALGTNTTFLAIASPSTAQNAAQIKALTRQNNGIIRLVLNRLEATS